MNSAPFALVFLLLAALPSAQAWAAGLPVKGVIKLPPDLLRVPNKPPGFWLLPNDVLPLLPPLLDPRTEMVVVLEGGGIPQATLVPPTLVMEDMRFNPSVLPVRPRTRVTFQNKDRVLHLLEAMQGSFMTAKRVDPGNRLEHTFVKEGTYPLHCSEVPHMVATVLVLDAPLFVLPDATGAFSFPEVPGGSHTIRVWYQGQWIHGQPLSVKGRTTVEIQLKQLSPKKKD